MADHGTIPSPAPTDLGTALLVAERTGHFPAAAWPALRACLLALGAAHAAGTPLPVAPQLAATVAPLRQLIRTRQALAAARQAVQAGCAALIAAGDDPLRLVEAANQLADRAIELAGRAQHLADLLEGGD